MKILIAAEDERMVNAIQSERPDDEFEVIDPTQLNKDTAVWEAVRGVDAVIHLGEIVGKIPGHQIDRATRGTYMLLRAAVDMYSNLISNSSPFENQSNGNFEFTHDENKAAAF